MAARFQLPEVKDILQKRDAYETAKMQFLAKILGDPEFYTLSSETIGYWLDSGVGDRALIAEITTALQSGPPLFHWGSEGACCADFETVPCWLVLNYFSDAVTCPACREVHAKDREHRTAYRLTGRGSY